jgi:AcrR family transcriptional regulator
VSGVPVRDRRAERRQATVDEILAAAWDLVRDQGVAALSVRELGARVGMRAQSLYVYFSSKHAIYDAMFAQANTEFLRRLQDGPEPDDPIKALHWRARVFVEFCLEDSARYQLLFQRTIPGFEPSAESYAIARRSLDTARAALGRAGLTEDAHLEVWTALTGGLVAQQLANDPGGTRFVRHVDEVIDMYLTHLKRQRRSK